jgi:hypothetical protein
MNMEQWWNDSGRGKPNNSEKTCPSATFPTTNPTWIDPDANPGLHGGGQRGGTPASCDLPESADSCCRHSRRSRTYSPKEGAAHQQPSGSSPVPSDRFDKSLKVTACGRTARPGKGKSPNIARIDNVVHQVQGHLRAKMMVVHLDRSAPYLGATRDEQP